MGEIKTCAKCGKNVSAGTTFCPQCGSFAFYTEEGTEGMVTELLQMLMFKYPKVALVFAIIFGIVLLGGAIYLFSL